MNDIRRRDKWSPVAVFIRQTARYPIACRSPGRAFRNSILAGFTDATYTPAFLLSYLNSAPVRWFHFHAQRDAQQGMPQVKISHLRALPAPAPQLVSALAAVGHELGQRGTGITRTERDNLDALACRAFELTNVEAAFVVAWARDNPPPAQRRAKVDESPSDGPSDTPPRALPTDTKGAGG